MKQRLRWVVIASCLLLIGLAAFIHEAYRVADAQYEQLVRLAPKSRDEVENVLRFCVARRIPIDKSVWGRNYSLREGEVCIQYLILAYEPIDVVYGPNNEVRHIFPSYE